MTTVRDGTVNYLGLTNPGVVVSIVPPTAFVRGVPTYIEGIVGVASWGAVNSPITFSDVDGGTAALGPAQIRPFDLMTYGVVGYQEGQLAAYKAIRVTDGTDTAASGSVPSNGGTFTAKCTGTRGNAISVVFQPTTRAGAYAAIVSFPGRQPERYDNISAGLATLTVTAGSGYTSVPMLGIPAPGVAGGVQAIAQVSLKVVTTAVVAGGTGYAVNDKIALPNGIVLTVATVSSGAVATVTLASAGSLAAGAVPSNPVAQSSTTGAGTGATFTLTWGLGATTIVNAGSGYTTSTPAVTLNGGGAGTGGSIAATASFWGGLATAINKGTIQRAASRCVVFTPGTSTAVPTLNTPIVLSGGSDGAYGVTTAQLVGQDALPRTGMYALRGTQCDSFAICDLTDPTTWAVQTAFAVSETMLAVTTTASGDSIANCVATRQSNGIDDTNIWIIEGDWPTVYDTQNGMARLVSPQAVALGRLGNLSPEQSPINKRLASVVATQTSVTGVPTASVDNSAAQVGGIDLIGKSQDLAQDFFSFLTGRNGSSNTAAQGIEYTRLTNFIARSLQGAATRNIVGLLQSTRPNDPTRATAKAVLDTFFGVLKNPAIGSGGYGLIDDFTVVCDETNNTPATQALNFLFAFVTVRYLNVVRIFIVKLNAGGNVAVSQPQVTAPTLAQLLAA